jgi:hypothetical protein
MSCTNSHCMGDSCPNTACDCGCLGALAAGAVIWVAIILAVRWAVKP